MDIFEQILSSKIIIEKAGGQAIDGKAGGPAGAVIPQENIKDLVEIPENIKGQIEIRPVKWIEEALDIALEHPPISLPVDQSEEIAIPPAENNTGKSLVKH